MRRKIILYGGLFSLVLLFAMSTFVGSVQAVVLSNKIKEEPCQLIKNCPVPAPTIVVPEPNISTYADLLVITGLSWNETLVDIYIDGVYNGRVELNLDDSGIANFAYRPFLSLPPGDHSIYTVARNLNERERSVESPEISFSIVVEPIVVSVVSKEIITEEPVIISEFLNNEDEEIVDEEVMMDSFGNNNQEEQPIDNNKDVIGVTSEDGDVNILVAPEEEGKVNVGEVGQIDGGVWFSTQRSLRSEEEQSEDGVSDLQKTIDRDQIIDEFFSEDEEIVAEQREIREKQNRQIGLAMLGVIIVIGIVWVIISSQSLPIDMERGQGGEEDKNTSLVKDEIVSKNKNKEVVISDEAELEEEVEDAMDNELDKLV